MLTNLMTVSQQVIILFLLIGVGVNCGKIRLLSELSVKEVTNFVLYIVTPCIMIQTFQRPFDAALAGLFLQAVLFAVITTVAAWLLARFTLHSPDSRRQNVYRFAAIFSNCGFMALPLENALLGSDGLFFGAAYLATLNVFAWTMGIQIMSGSPKPPSLKKILLNPCVIGVFVGLALFFSSITLPQLIETPVEYLAALNTPLPMIVIGYHLSKADLTSILRDLRAWLAMTERLILIPLIGLAIGLAMHMDTMAFIACMVGLCAPTGAICTMFSVTHGQDTELSVSLVSVSTLLSILTMPLIIVLAQTLVGFSG